MSSVGSSALVNVAEDAELRLVRHLAESAESTSQSFVQDCETSISQGNAANLMSKILAEKGAIQALLLDDEAVSAVSLLAALLDRAKDSQLVDKLADSLIQVSADTTKTISLLVTLYNMRNEVAEKVRLIVKMIELAAERRPSLLEPNSSVLGKWMDPSKLSALLEEWKVNPLERRALYLAASKGASLPVAKQRFTLLVLETYSASNEVDSLGLEVSEQAAIGAIRDPVSLFEYQRNILSLPAIQALEQNSAQLFALLKVFQEGKLEDYFTFISSNGGENVLEQWENISAENCVRYMRILSLCSLAAEHEEIPYHVIAETLQTALEDVEKWVIAAVSSGLVAAKMDQLQSKVVVERCVIRQFGVEQWKVVQSRLRVWKQNVGGILEAYRQSLQQRQQ